MKGSASSNLFFNRTFKLGHDAPLTVDYKIYYSSEFVKRHI
jgi:hypothetical protein